MSVLKGLLGTEALASNRFNNWRRTVFYDYPNGALPILGLLSVTELEDPVSDPDFKWFEDRWPERKTLTTAWAAGSNGPFADDTGVALSTGAGTTLVPTMVYRLQLADTNYVRANNVLFVKGVANHAATATFDMMILVLELISTTQIRFKPLETYTLVGNANTINIGLGVVTSGSAYQEGALQASQVSYPTPVALNNYTQIFRSAFAFTGSELQTSLKFDKTGIYKDKSKKSSLQHMTDIERALLWGVKSIGVDATTGLPTRTTAGVLAFLRAWEAGTDYGVTASTVNSDDNKRIININGAITLSDFEMYLERLFRVTNNETNEKLCMCGNGFIQVLNNLYRGATVLKSDLPMTGVWGQDIIGHKTPWGTLYYKSHPLFNQSTVGLRNNALFLDVHNIKYRPMVNRDTTLKDNVQPNGADLRQDEYLTEGGFEVRFPESHMYMTGVNSAV